jgi:hypothetical protein
VARRCASSRPSCAASRSARHPGYEAGHDPRHRFHSNLLMVPCRPPQIAKGFALRHNQAESCRVPDQKIRHNHAATRLVHDTDVRCACQIVTLNPASRMQTP